MDKAFLMSLTDMGEDVAEAILAQNEKEVEAVQLQLQQAAAENEKAMKQLRLDGWLQGAIAREKGKNAKAITALLDREGLQEADEAAVLAAVQAVKKECGYLFESNLLPPGFASGTGAAAPMPRGPGSLAEALRERFERR